MSTKRNRYTTRTEDNVKDAMLRLLEAKPLTDITISELACEAGISRSTFYEHYGNTADVYDALVGEIAEELSPILDQITCSHGLRPAGTPFCALVRDGGAFAPVVSDNRFAETYLSQNWTQEGHNLYAILVDAGYAESEARAVCSFQMSGCFAAARSSNADEAEWASIRAVIDRFILGGIAACLAVKKPD